jgi:phosphatidylglycerophosphatase A
LSNKKIPISYLKNPLHFLSLGFGSGLAPFAPGTFGTLVAIPLYWWASQLSLIAFLVTIVLGFAVGVYLCGYTSKALGVHDHSGIVWDEIVGYFITMIAVPLDWRWMLAGFVLFRLFDIVKPWPIRWVDKHLYGGFGIMFDDVLAGIFALLSLHFLIYLI